MRKSMATRARTARMRSDFIVAPSYIYYAEAPE
jgi:hypothetical protein